MAVAAEIWRRAFESVGRLDESTALLLADAQQEYDHGHRAQAERNVIRAFRSLPGDRALFALVAALGTDDQDTEQGP